MPKTHKADTDTQEKESLDALIERAVAILKERWKTNQAGMRCSEVGFKLWPDYRGGSNCSNPLTLPAGRVLHAAMRKGLVTRYRPRGHYTDVWRAT